MGRHELSCFPQQNFISIDSKFGLHILGENLEKQLAPVWFVYFPPHHFWNVSWNRLLCDYAVRLRLELKTNKKETRYQKTQFSVLVLRLFVVQWSLKHTTNIRARFFKAIGESGCAPAKYWNSLRMRHPEQWGWSPRAILLSEMYSKCILTVSNIYLIKIKFVELQLPHG